MDEGGTYRDKKNPPRLLKSNIPSQSQKGSYFFLLNHLLPVMIAGFALVCFFEYLSCIILSHKASFVQKSSLSEILNTELEKLGEQVNFFPKRVFISSKKANRFSQGVLIGVKVPAFASAPTNQMIQGSDLVILEKKEAAISQVKGSVSPTYVQYFNFPTTLQPDSLKIYASEKKSSLYAVWFYSCLHRGNESLHG